MTETYREEQEANIGEESVAHRFTKGLEDMVGVQNAFGSEDLATTDEEDNEEHEHDREADVESDYEDDEMSYN